MNHTYIAVAKSKDVDQRARRYLINMGIRMACLLLILVVPGWWKLVFFVGAALLPMVAVMFANDQAIAKPIITTSPITAELELTASNLPALAAADLEPIVMEPLQIVAAEPGSDEESDG